MDTPPAPDSPPVAPAAVSAELPAVSVEPAVVSPLPPVPVSGNDNDRFYQRAFATIATVIAAVLLYKILEPFLGPLMWSLFLAFLLHPLHVRLTRRFKGRENLSSILLTLTTLLVLIGPLAAMSAAFAAQVGDLVQWLQTTIGKQPRAQYRVLVDLPLVGPALQWLSDNFGVRAAQVQSWLAQGAQHLPPLLAGMGGKIFLGAVNTVLAFTVMLFMLFFFIRDGAGGVAAVRDLIPMQAAHREQLMQHAAAVTRAVVFGTGITALVQGALVGVAFAITGLSSPVVFGVLAALFALLPFGGTAIVWVPAVLFLGFQDKWGMSIVMLVIGVFSASIDNILRPWLVSGRAEVGTLTVFIGVLGGTAAFGPIGLFLGPVLLALIISMAKFALQIRRAA